MASTVVSKDLEEYDPEAKLEEDEKKGINIETMSLSGNEDAPESEDVDPEDDLDPEDIIDQGDPEEEEEDNENITLSDDVDVLKNNLGINVIGNESKQNYISESDDDDDDEIVDFNESMKKIEQDINKDILYSYHPEIKQINYKELLTLSNVVKNERGEIIDPLHKTIPFLTCYEKARILGMRAKQINNGSKPFVEVPKSIIDGHTIALMELNKQKIPFIIRRPMPNGGSEYWKVSDLKNLD